MCKVALAAAMAAALTTSGMNITQDRMEQELERVQDSAMPFVMLVRNVSGLSTAFYDFVQATDRAKKIEKAFEPLKADFDKFIKQREHERTVKNQIRNRLRSYRLFKRKNPLPVNSRASITEDEIWPDNDYPEIPSHKGRRLNGRVTDFDDLRNYDKD